MLRSFLRNIWWSRRAGATFCAVLNAGDAFQSETSACFEAYETCSKLRRALGRSDNTGEIVKHKAYAAAQVVVTAIAVCDMLLYMPVRLEGKHLIQVHTDSCTNGCTEANYVILGQGSS